MSTIDHAPQSFAIPSRFVPARRSPDGLRKVVLSERRCPRIAVITLTGELDVHDSDGVRKYIGRLIHDVPAVILDLRGLTRLEVGGLRALSSIDQGCADAGVPWALILGGPDQELVNSMNLNRVLPVMLSAEAALRQLSVSVRARRLASPLTPRHATRC